MEAISLCAKSKSNQEGGGWEGATTPLILPVCIPQMNELLEVFILQQTGLLLVICPNWKYCVISCNLFLCPL